MTSIAMFYDIEDPIAFARQVEQVPPRRRVAFRAELHALDAAYDLL